MSKRTAWAHLPNAHHIDRILNDVKQRPRVWADPLDASRIAEWEVTQDAAWDAAWCASRDVEWDATWDATWDAARSVAWDAAWITSRGAVAALVAWDDAGDILDMPPDAVRLLAASGHHPAVLLLPAAVALATTI